MMTALGSFASSCGLPITSGLLPKGADRFSVGRCRLQGAVLPRQLPLLVCPALDCRCLAMPRDHSHSLVNPGDHVVRRAALQESDAVLAASRQDTVARRLHFQWVRLAWNREVTERKT